MKSSRILMLALALVLFPLGASFMSADAAVRPRRSATPKPKINAHGGIIESVSSSSITLKISKKTLTYQIDGHTEVTLDGRRATTSSLRKGMRAEITPGTLDPSAARFIAADDGAHG